MKRTVIVFLTLLSISLTGFAQDSTSAKKDKSNKRYSVSKNKQKEPNQTLYVSIGESFSILKDFTTGLEIGSWGINSNPITYALTFDYNRNLQFKSNSVFLGVKPQYYFLNNKNSGMYVYVAPKFQVFNSDISAKKFDFLFEYGIGGYYSANKPVILQLGLGAQTIYSQVNMTGGKPFIPSVGVSINYIK